MQGKTREALRETDRDTSTEVQGKTREALRETNRLRHKYRGAGKDKGATERGRQAETQTHRGAGKDKGGTGRDKQTETQAQRCRERQGRHGERQTG